MYSPTPRLCILLVVRNLGQDRKTPHSRMSGESICTILDGSDPKSSCSYGYSRIGGIKKRFGKSGNGAPFKSKLSCTVSYTTVVLFNSQTHEFRSIVQMTHSTLLRVRTSGLFSPQQESCLWTQFDLSALILTINLFGEPKSDNNWFYKPPYFHFPYLRFAIVTSTFHRIRYRDDSGK